MNLVRRDFARCFTGKARVPETAAPAGPAGGDEPPGRNDPPGRGLLRGSDQAADPPSTSTSPRPVGLRPWLQRSTATAAPGDSSGEAPAEPAPARGRDPP
jgi:hypothetical protein